MQTELKYLNCGCGSRFILSWENVDFVSNSPHVKQYDLSKGIPYDDNSFDVVYHSHVLEHFSKRSAVSFIKECHRVLRPGGVIRIAVPDLEQLAKSYLQNLNTVTQEYTDLNHANYQWSVIELFDQMVRNSSGGEMQKYWETDMINEEFIAGRVGFEFKEYRSKRIDLLNKKQVQITPKNNKSYRPILSGLRLRIKEYLLKKHLPFINLGMFRLSGEVHQWMYDRYSLSCFLKESGFTNITVKDAFTSDISGWNEFRSLDVEEGKPRKPDSLFMEAYRK